MEIIISVTILSVFFVMAISTATAMIHNMKVTEHRLLATYYAEDLMTWLRSERERDWQEFKEMALDPVTSATVPGGRTYCVNRAATADETLSTLLTSDSSCASADYSGIVHPSDTNAKIYKRQVNIRVNPANTDQIDATVTIWWLELEREYFTTTVSSFTFLE